MDKAEEANGESGSETDNGAAEGKADEGVSGKAAGGSSFEATCLFNATAGQQCEAGCGKWKFLDVVFSALF